MSKCFESFYKPVFLLFVLKVYFGVIFLVDETEYVCFVFILSILMS